MRLGCNGTALTPLEGVVQAEGPLLRAFHLRENELNDALNVRLLRGYTGQDVAFHSFVPAPHPGFAPMMHSCLMKEASSTAGILFWKMT